VFHQDLQALSLVFSSQAFCSVRGFLDRSESQEEGGGTNPFHGLNSPVRISDVRLESLRSLESLITHITSKRFLASFFNSRADLRL
jgi:hypothetical protein